MNDRVNYNNLVVNDKRGSDGGGSGEIDGGRIWTEIVNMIVTKARKGKDLLTERESGVRDEPEIFCRGSR